MEITRENVEKELQQTFTKLKIEEQHILSSEQKVRSKFTQLTKKIFKENPSLTVKATKGRRSIITLPLMAWLWLKSLMPDKSMYEILQAIDSNKLSKKFYTDLHQILEGAKSTREEE